MACFVVFRRKLPSQPIVVEQSWPTKRARVSGSRRKTSQWLEQFGAETATAVTEIVEVHTVETEAVHSVETEAAIIGTEETAAADIVEVHTVETEVVHSVKTEAVQSVETETVETVPAIEAVHTVENDQTESAREFHEVIPSSPAKKTKMISELVCAVKPKTRNAKAKKGTRRGWKR